MEYYGLPIEERVRVAIGLASGPAKNGPDPDLIRAALQTGPIPPAAIKHKRDSGKTLLHALALGTGRFTDTDPFITERFRKGSPKADLPGRRFAPLLHRVLINLGLRALTRELIAGGADLHAIYSRAVYQRNPSRVIGEDIKIGLRYTPLLCIFWGELTGHYFQVRESFTSHHHIKLWLEDLELCGIDLCEYGRKEKDLFDQSRVSREFITYDGHTFHLVNFTFGASPSDWQFYFLEPTDEFAGDFWSLVEEPEEKVMPGMWVD